MALAARHGAVRVRAAVGAAGGVAARARAGVARRAVPAPRGARPGPGPRHRPDNNDNLLPHGTSLV